jgi:thiol-activated cytolysin
MSFDTSSKKKGLYALYKQTFYTVSCDPPKRPSDLMGRKVTLKEVQRVMTAAEPPAYVQSVSYGRMLLLRIETSSERTEAEVEAAVEASKGSVTAKAEMEAKHKAVLADSSITWTSLGGSATAAAKLVNAPKDPTALGKLIQRHSEFTKTNPGEPIAYTVMFLQDNRVATMGYTTDYTQVDCKVYPKGYVYFDHKGDYVVNCKVTWKEYVKDRAGKWRLVDREWTWNKGTVLVEKRCPLNPGATDVEVRAERYVFFGVKSDINLDPHHFEAAPRVTYTFKPGPKVEVTVGK